MTHRKYRYCEFQGNEDKDPNEKSQRRCLKAGRVRRKPFRSPAAVLPAGVIVRRARLAHRGRLDY